jgi:hypothetical protein
LRASAQTRREMHLARNNGGLVDSL